MASPGSVPTPDGATTTSELVPPSPPPSLQDRIQTLTDLHSRLQSLRHVPTLLLRPPSASPLADFSPPFDPEIDREFAVTFNATPAHDFRALKGFQDALRSDKVQAALRAARVSEDADHSELGFSFRRDGRRQKSLQSPVGSPQPYVPSPPRSSSLFAPAEDDPPPICVEMLPEFVREFNRGNDSTSPKCKLAFWSRTKAMENELKTHSMSNTSGGWKPRSGRLISPVVLRFIIPDVLTAYMSLIFTDMESALIVESVAAFGPRERKLPHEQSDYLAFQGLSQHLTKMVLSHPRVPVQVIMNVLVSYRGLFVDRCASCQRVLSTEGHIPPVARIWVVKEGVAADGPVTQNAASPPGADHENGHWEPRHAACLYN